MLTSASQFIGSSFAVGHNVVKAILFRIAGILIQLFVIKFFSLLAYYQRSFTAYLMFTEDYVQRAIFIFTRGFGRHAMLVLFLTIFLLGAALYDTLLWGLDSPGFIHVGYNVSSLSLKNQLLDSPGYVVTYSNAPSEEDSLEKLINQLMRANLYEDSVNFTFTGVIERGSPESVPPTRKPDPSRNLGPRLWLDNEGFSVSLDTLLTFAVLDEETTFDCPWKGVSHSGASWECMFDNKFASYFIQSTNIGIPEIHWDDASDLFYQSRYLRTNRTDNPWSRVGSGGGTAAMKQMFSVTKGRRKHTFIEDVIKICAVLDYETAFPEKEVFDLVKRSWSTDPEYQKDPRVAQISEKIALARSQNSSLLLGGATKAENSVAQFNYELLNAQGAASDDVLYSLLRISVANITHIRSETLPEPVKPAEQCNGRYFQNIATGGKVHGTDCYASNGGDTTYARFYGEVDTSAVLVVSGPLGDGASNKSATAFNQKTFEWMEKNIDYLNSLVLSRGYIMAIPEAAVTLGRTSLQPAMSYLQVTLVVLPFLFLAIVWTLLFKTADAHYSSSLLANIYATTNMGETFTSKSPGYMTKIPDIKLVENEGKVDIATSTGVLILDESKVTKVAVSGVAKESIPLMSH
ncbi:hypothetical protein FQN57_003475 [Myotisia sp. PD_48]|nr:hypothetical protein FQN57_003475 [Myotisia sp. PD_48]